MSLNVTSPLPDKLIAALCDTLVYSLLQGILLAAIAGLIIVLTRNASAARRYNMLVGVLVLFAIGSGVTFAVQLKRAAVPAVRAMGGQAGNINAIQVIDHGAAISGNNKTDILATISGYLSDHHNTIVLIWFMVICVRCIQLATGLQGIYLLKRNKVDAVDTDWQQWVQQTANLLGIKQKVALLASGLAKVPMVVGHLKPVILIPVGLLTTLSTDQVEAILMHELAHIRRRDYLVNLLQNMVEIVFFFNPAVLWLSQLIKTEREHCCDDMALAQNAGKASYIRALVSCEEYQQAVPAYAMAFPGQKNHLVDRVKRMMTNRNHSLDTFEKTLLTVCLVVAGLLTTAFTNTPQINKLVRSTQKVIGHATESIAKKIAPAPQDTPAKEKPQAEVAEPAVVAPADTVPGDKITIYKPIQVKEGTEKIITKTNFTTYLYKQDGTLYQLNLVEGSLRSVQINGVNLSPEEQASRKPEIDRVLSKIDADAAKTNGSLGKLSGNLSSLSGQLGRLNGNINTTTGDSVSKRRALPVQPKLHAVAPAVTPVPRVNYNSTYPVNSYKPDTNNYNKDRSRYQAKAAKYGDDSKAIIDDMIKDGLIKSRDNLSFKIGTSEFVINYKKQPDDVYKRYRAKYVKLSDHGDWNWMYNYDTEKHTESSTTIDNTSEKKPMP